MHILSAIAGALRSVFAAGRAVMSLPFRLLGSIGEGGYVMPPEDDEDEPIVAQATPPAPVFDLQEIWRDHAIVLQSWCADAVAMGGPMPIPPRLPRAVQQWAPGLSPDECREIYRSSETAVSAHLQGLFDIPGVRKVAPLPLANWPIDVAGPQSDDAEPVLTIDALLAR
ncbi:hypothetical protein Rpal_3797 [Rhodopseudomonas palustris TIE-1]|uniref:hypothetical protein n=1 Tax=Rhodopseudomonas palustris TaxID=1076 RepID=UPI000164B311|nr:hypothetical protein [Rhodopseudomonas palustris]ACF02296.1 hypothetical protein Rpal_3797 [Rhodopseudomonas palustris TIE-1]